MRVAAERPADLDALRSALIFRGFEEAVLRALISTCRHRAHDAGESVSRGGEGADSVGVVVAGQVSISLLSMDAQELLLRECGPPSVFLLGTVPPEPAAGTLCTASEDETVAYLFGMDRVVGLCSSHGQSAVDLVRLLQRTVADQQQLLAEQTFCSVRQRLAGKLARLSQRGGATVSYTREELARALGTTRDPAARALSELRDEGLISFEPRGREIVVLDPVRLRRRASSHG